MSFLVFFTALAVWYVIAVFAHNNRFLRDTYYGPMVGARLAHLVGVVLQIAFIYAITYLWLNWLELSLSAVSLWTVGGLWVLLAVLAEPAFYYHSGLSPWREVMKDYNLMHGRLWLLVLVALLYAPTHISRWLSLM